MRASDVIINGAQQCRRKSSQFDITLKPAASCPGSPQGCRSDKAMAWTPRHFSRSDETFDAWLEGRLGLLKNKSEISFRLKLPILLYWHMWGIPLPLLMVPEVRTKSWDAVFHFFFYLCHFAHHKATHYIASTIKQWKNQVLIHLSKCLLLCSYNTLPIGGAATPYFSAFLNRSKTLASINIV